MHPIVRGSFFVATGGVVVGGSLLTIPTAPILAVAGIAAGTIVLVKCVKGKGSKNKDAPDSRSNVDSSKNLYK
jgi:hypothetical protein